MQIRESDITIERMLNLFYLKIRNNSKTSALNFSSRLIPNHITIDHDTVMLTILLLGSEGSEVHTKTEATVWDKAMKLKSISFPFVHPPIYPSIIYPTILLYIKYLLKTCRGG